MSDGVDAGRQQRAGQDAQGVAGGDGAGVGGAGGGAAGEEGEGVRGGAEAGVGEAVAVHRRVRRRRVGAGGVEGRGEDAAAGLQERDGLDLGNGPGGGAEAVEGGRRRGPSPRPAGGGEAVVADAGRGGGAQGRLVADAEDPGLLAGDDGALLG